MKNFKASKFLIIAITMMLLLSCIKKEYPHSLVIVVGRHANANEFSEANYTDLKEYINTIAFDNYYGSYIGAIISDGRPFIVNESFDDFLPISGVDKNKRDRINKAIDSVMAEVRNPQNRAISDENDLLRAIFMARNLLKDFEKSSGRGMESQTIFILDTGIATAGYLNFLRHGINHSFTDAQIPAIIDSLREDHALPDLNGIKIVFRGINDVSWPQTSPLPRRIESSIVNLWTTILKESGAIVDINNDTTRGSVPNLINFPYVTPIKFDRPDIQDPVNVRENLISFLPGGRTPVISENGRYVLREYTKQLKTYLDQNPNVRLYIVGSESKETPTYNPDTGLSTDRAEAVKTVLLNYEPLLPINQLDAFGLAVSYPDREYEFVSGVYDEDIGKRNRIVVLVLSDYRDATNLVGRIENERRRLYPRWR